jgi:hypothetical protein
MELRDLQGEQSGSKEECHYDEALAIDVLIDVAYLKIG